MTFNEMLQNTKRQCSVTGTAYDTFLTQGINDGQQDFTRELNLPYTETKGSLAVVAYQQAYTTATDVDTITGVTYKQKYNLIPVNYNQWIELNKRETTGIPRYYIIHESKLKIYPPEDTAAPTGTATPAITSTSTAVITLSSPVVANLKQRGRGIIDSEVVDWQYVDLTNNKIKICTRGAEGTTAATHASTATFTYRELEYSYFKSLADLSAGDTSTVPARYHEAMVLYSSARFFLKNEDRMMHDNLMGKYEMVKNQAKADLGEKQAQRFTTTLEDTQPRISRGDETYPEDSSLTAA